MSFLRQGSRAISIFALLVCLSPNGAQAAVLSAGDLHSLAVRPNGMVAGWGSNFFGESSGGSAGTNVVAIASGKYYHNLALHSGESVSAWGFDGSGETEAPGGASFIAIAAGSDHSLALTSAGQVVGWGWNGPDDAPDYRADGSRAGSGNVAIAAGGEFSAALKSNGAIVAWGVSDEGQTNVPGPNAGFATISAGFNHGLALTRSGFVVGWGNNDDNQISVPGGGNFAAIAGGFNYSLGLRNDGTVTGWGYNWDGVTGGPAFNSDIVAIAAGNYHAIALRSDGTLTAWGNNFSGQAAAPAGIYGPSVAIWNSPEGGNFLGSYNWLHETPSTAVSDAFFGVPTDPESTAMPTYSVDFNADARARFLFISAGNDVTFNLEGKTFRLEENAIIGLQSTFNIDGIGGLELKPTKQLHVLDQSQLILGSEAGANGELSLLGPLTVTGGSTVIVGKAGGGRLTLGAGATASFTGVNPETPTEGSSLVIGQLAGSDGQVNITGGSLSVSHVLDIGQAGRGIIQLTNQVQLALNAEADLTLGQLPGSDGTLDVRDTSSVNIPGGGIVVGRGGTGTLRLAAGADLMLGGPIRLGVESTGYGRIEMNGGTLNFSALDVGELGSGTVNVAAAGNVTAIDVRLGKTSGELGEITITGENSKVTASGSVTVGEYGNGKLDIREGGTFRQAAQQLFHVAKSPGSTGEVMIGRGSLLESPSAVQLGGAPGMIGGDATMRIERGGKLSTESEGQSGAIRVNEKGILEFVNSPAVEEASLVQTEAVFIQQGGLLKVSGVGEIRKVEPSPSPHATTQVQNAGTIELRGARLQRNDAIWRSGIESHSSSLYIDGDYNQSAAGALELTGLNASHRLQPGSHLTSGMIVTGTATLDGTLELAFAQGYTPEIGDRFAIVSAQKIEGRIATFDDAVVPNATDRFLGLNYRRQGVGQEAILEAITLRAPIRVAGSANSPNLILVTHGTNANAYGWADDIASSMGLHANQMGQQWQAMVLDWEPFNGGSTDEFAVIGARIPLLDIAFEFDPWLSANNGINIGESLVRWFEQTDVSFSTAHLLGHSSGSWLVDAIVDDLEGKGLVGPTQLTLFDAFTPTVGGHLASQLISNIRKQGFSPLTTASLGDTADFAEHYLHRGLIWTDETLPQAIKYDLVYPLAPGSIVEQLFASHAFPYEWYLETAKHPDDVYIAVGGTGAASAPAYNGSTLLSKKYGELHLITQSDPQFPPVTPIRVLPQITPINLNEHTGIVTGNVTIAQNGTATLQTASPAILTSMIDVEESFRAIQFDFGMDAPGLLSVYFGDQQIFGLEGDESITSATDLFSSGWIWLDAEQAPGPYSLTFRIDPLGEETVVAEIANLSFIHLAEAPTIVGDFDSDGDIDGRDFLAWQRGESPNPLSGSDLADWQANFGIGSLVVANVAVPEPGSIGLLAFALACCGLRRGDRR